jgi:hypothetical protein
LGKAETLKTDVDKKPGFLKLLPPGAPAKGTRKDSESVDRPPPLAIQLSPRFVMRPAARPPYLPSLLFPFSAFQRFSVSAFQRFSVSAFQRFSGSAVQRFSGSAFQRFSGSDFQHLPPAFP